VAAVAGVRNDERMETVNRHYVFYLLDADGVIVEAPVPSSNFSMACVNAKKTYA